MTAATDKDAPHPPPVKVVRLPLDAGTRDTRRALARLFNDLRAGHVDTKTAGTAAYVLTALLKAIEIDVIDKRIAALEERTIGKGAAR